MNTPQFPRRVQTSIIRKAKGKGLRRNGFNYRLLAGQALAVYQEALIKRNNKQ